MKKLAFHIKPLAIFLTFLIVFTITGKLAHVFFSDCDHNSSISIQDQHDHVNQLTTDIETSSCDWCKFIPQTPTLADTPLLESITVTYVIALNGVQASQCTLQNQQHSSQLRGPPSLS